MNVSPTSSPASDAATRTAVTQTLAALVFREVLKPLAAALGPAGDVVLDGVIDRTLLKPKP